MIASQIPPGVLSQPIVATHEGRQVTITRRHRAPKGKVTVTYTSASGVGMTTMDDTERLDVVEPVRRGRLVARP